MTYGEKGRRTKPRVKVLRGYGGNEPTSLTFSAPVNASHTDIKSGMVISISSGQWVKGCAQNAVPYIAYHDASDTDVDSSGLLLGLSCAGDFEIETGYFDGTDTYVRDDAVIAGTAGLLGSLDKAAIMVGGAAAGGQGTIADIVGFVTKGKAQVQAGTKSLVAFGGTANYFDPAQNINSEATIGAISTLTFITRWTPMRTAETA